MRPAIRSFWTLIIIVCLVFIGCFVTIVPAYAQTASAISTVENNGVTVPDWSSITFNNLPPILEEGSFQSPADVNSAIGYDASRTWQAGMLASDYLKLGDFQGAFELQNFNLTTIGAFTGKDPSNYLLSSFGLVEQQNLSQMVQAVEGLGSYQVGQVAPVRDLVSQMGVMSSDTELISDFLSANPQAGELKFSNLNLKQYPISSIPGLQDAQLANFNQWRNMLISQIPDLGDVAWDKLPNPVQVLGMVGTVDMTYGPKESKRTNTISGSNREGFQVPCVTNCAYVEFSGPLHGKQWISGKYQEVKGGEGVLGVVNGGKEPTGRHPFGPAFKVALWEITESEGSVTSAIFFRYCHRGIPDLGCTPYFIGPVPFMSTKEMQPFFVGLLDPLGGATSGISIPKYEQTADGYNETAGSGGECIASGSIDRSRLDRTTRSLISSVPVNQEGASQMVPYITRACAQAGVTDSSQLAYILATAEHETDNFRTMREYDQTPYDACGAGEGMIQVTWCSNKEQVFRRLGLPAYGGTGDTRLQQPEVAAAALCRGMKEGWFGQGRPIGQCIAGGRADYACARQQVNDHDRIDSIAERARRYNEVLQQTGSKDAGQTTGAAVPQGSGGNCNSKGGNVPAGEINQRILQAAQQARGESTAEFGGGNLACAWQVNRVLERAGIKPVGANATYVPSVHESLRGGRGTAVSSDQAQAGDIVIAPNDEHIGICMDNGCNRVLSNSSSRAAFSWESNANFDGYYGSGQSQIYRVSN
jgi:hypothetical protein